MIAIDSAAAGQGEATPATSSAPAFLGSHQSKPLKFDPAKLDGLSERLIRSHRENNKVW
jgi:Fe-Mn family superoxide dismutase